MFDAMLKNGKPLCTLIQRFGGGVVVVGPNAAERVERPSIESAREFIEAKGWEIGIIHPRLRKEGQVDDSCFERTL